MQCLYCTHENTKVIDSRESGSEIRRRRECEGCEKRFTTYERAEMQLTVIKKDGTREAYSREKLKGGLQNACNKRPVSEEQVEEIVKAVETKILTKGEIESKKIGEVVLKNLKGVDKVCYLRFASVCRGFDSVKEFEKELKSLKVAK